MKAFDPDREAVLQRARENGIEAIITIASDFESNEKALALARQYDFICLSLGIHPHDAKDFTDAMFEMIKDWARKYSIRHGASRGEVKTPGDKVVAIGEIGLDYHYDHSPRDVQRDVFLRQLLLAGEADLPVIIHSREAQEDTLDIVGKSGVSKGVFHCFSGDIEMAEQVIRMGFHISVAGPVTFRNAETLRAVVRNIPDEYLLIETDAPYLAPVPCRGKRNEPAYLVHTAALIAGLRGITPEDLARITTLNARRLFRLGGMPGKGEVAYKIRQNLYLNITNRCTNRCSFCIRFHSDYVKGHNLRLSYEPAEEELKRAIGDPSDYREIVFCGYGEPLLRFDLVKRVATWIKQEGGRVRINTNGHGNLINGRNILPEMKGIVDSLSISLDAQDEETYRMICRPSFPNAFQEVLSFIREAKKYVPEIVVTVVALDGVDIEKCGKIAHDLGVRFKIRKPDVVG
jgi:TatD DNase family protein